MKRRRQAIKRRNIQQVKTRSYNKLYRETKKQVQEVNRRLESLERSYKKGTWSSGKLYGRIKANKVKGLLYKGKRIKLKPRMSKTNLTQVLKSTKQFLDSATSTKKGISKVKAETIKQLKDTLNLNRKAKLSDSDVEELYSMLSNKDFDRFNVKKKGREDEYIGASAMWSEIDYASRNNLSADSFIDRLQNLRMQDFSLDEKQAAQRIYETYVL